MSNSRQACAACKYQRRRCSEDCIMAPFFPAEQPKKFLNVHRLFGVGNFLKSYRAAAPELRQQAAEAMIYEARMREVDPVLGCFGIISKCEAQIIALRQELGVINSKINIYRQQRGQQMWQQGQQMQPVPPQPPPLPSQIDFYRQQRGQQMWQQGQQMQLVPPQPPPSPPHVADLGASASDHEAIRGDEATSSSTIPIIGGLIKGDSHDSKDPEGSA